MSRLNPPLEGFELESDWAKRKGLCQRTPARYREQGLLEFLEWGGRVWIRTADGEKLIRSRIKRRNPPRRARRDRNASQRDATLVE
jgi:hypothetical protein